MKLADGSPPDPEAELRLAEPQMSTILAIAADAIISLNEHMRIVVFNEGASAIFGYAKDEIIGQPLDVLIPERFRTTHHGHVTGFAESRVAARRMGERQEIFARRKDGSEFPAKASIAKQVIGGRHIFMVVLRDVTERKRAQAELARANTDLERREAQALLAADQDKLIERDGEAFRVTDRGRPFARAIASCFDAYFDSAAARHAPGV